jgi:hypothetical protein
MVYDPRMTRQPLKTELHHWWPRTLAEHWSADDGMVSVIRPSGDTRRAPPGAFGAITNAHHIKLGSPWDSTFEPLFNQPDGEISEFVRWLATLKTELVSHDRPMFERITPQILSEERQSQMARVTASLLARSPSIRHSIKLGVEQFRPNLSQTDPVQAKVLISSNQRGLYDAYRKRMESSGRWAILLSDEKEFIAGDGFLHNFPASQDGINSGKKLVLPIIPTMSIVYMLPMQYPTEPRVVTLRLSNDEVAELNAITQVYARDFLFFREDQPELTESFKMGCHQIFQYHGHDWLDALLDDLSQYTRWEKNVAPRISHSRPYTKSLEGNRWLDGLMTKDE